MTDAQYRLRAHAFIRAAANNGEMGHCIGCGKHVAGGVPHAKGCQVPELLEAGAREETS